MTAGIEVNAFSVEYTLEALEFLKKSDQQISKRIFSKISQAAGNPFHFFLHLQHSGLHKLRVGDYRVLAAMEVSQKKIFILKIGHRKNVYE